jgi:mannose-6-phosphate isomerase
VTRDEFERRSRDGTVAGLFHVHAVTAGDVMFLPSGRVHALGGGNLVFEVQQNSDTTYRVFDWNRVGADGRPRELHLERSLASIDFFDCEPGLVGSRFQGEGAGLQRRPLVRDPLFCIDLWRLAAGARLQLDPGQLHVLAGVSGGAVIAEGGVEVECVRGAVTVLPAASRAPVVATATGAEFLVVRPGTP